MKYKTEDYFSVINKKTGRKIADCGEWSDAMMLLDFDPQNRSITRNQFLMGQVVDIEIPKSLPTTEVVQVKKDPPKKLKEYQNKLPKSELEPLKL